MRKLLIKDFKSMRLKDCLTMHVQFCSNCAYSYLFINSLIRLSLISKHHDGEMMVRLDIYIQNN
jgi:hypothetical protein